MEGEGAAGVADGAGVTLAVVEELPDLLPNRAPLGENDLRPDTCGGVLPGVTVTARQTETGLQRTTTPVMSGPSAPGVCSSEP